MTSSNNNDNHLLIKEFIALKGGVYDSTKGIVYFPKEEHVKMLTEIKRLNAIAKANDHAYYNKEKVISQQMEQAIATYTMKEKEYLRKQQDLTEMKEQKQKMIRNEIKEGNDLQLKLKELKERKQFELNQKLILSNEIQLKTDIEKEYTKKNNSLKEQVNTYKNKKEDILNKYPELLHQQSYDNKSNDMYLNVETIPKNIQKQINDILSKVNRFRCPLCKDKIADVLYEGCNHLGCCVLCYKTINNERKKIKGQTLFCCPRCKVKSSKCYKTYLQNKE